MGLAFLVTAWVARYLGTEGYGTYIYAVGLAELCMLFWSQGLKEVIIHETRKREDEQPGVTVAAFQLMAAGNTLLYGLLAVVVFFIDSSQIVMVLALLCGLGIWFRSFEAFELWFHARLEVRQTVRVQFVAQFLYMAANVLLILIKADLVWFGITYMAQLIFVGVGFWITYIRQSERSALKLKSPELKKNLLRYGKFMILAKLTLTASFLIDRIFIEYFVGLEAVGIYTAAMKMTTTWTFIASSISLSYLPVITAENYPQNQQKYISDMFGWITLSGLLLLLPFYLLSDYLVYLLFGEQYVASSAIFKTLIWALPFILLNEGIKAWLVVTKKARYYVVAMLCTLTLIILGNVLLLPVYQLQGAAITFLVSWLFGGCLIFLGFKATRDTAKSMFISFLFPFKILAKFKD